MLQITIKNDVVFNVDTSQNPPNNPLSPILVINTPNKIIKHKSETTIKEACQSFVKTSLMLVVGGKLPNLTKRMCQCTSFWKYQHKFQKEKHDTDSKTKPNVSQKRNKHTQLTSLSNLTTHQKHIFNTCNLRHTNIRNITCNTYQAMVQPGIQIS